METLFLSKKEVESAITMADAIRAVEDGFREKSNVEKSVKAWLFYTKQGGDLALWSAYMPSLGASGMKAIGYNTSNYKKGLPTITAVIILYDPDTSFPIAIMDGTSITRIRTGAAGAIAAKHLARKNSEVVALIGAGVQGGSQIEGLNEVFKLKEVRIFDASPERAQSLAERLGKTLKAKVVVAKDAESAVRGADIVATATPAHDPIVMEKWVAPGTHINAIGADEPGKEELEASILKKARIVVDDMAESVRRGETNVPITKGVIKESDIYAELEEVITGAKKGRQDDRQITVFDATGIALEDVAVAWEAYNKAKKLGIGSSRRFVVD